MHFGTILQIRSNAKHDFDGHINQPMQWTGSKWHLAHSLITLFAEWRKSGIAKINSTQKSTIHDNLTGLRQTMNRNELVHFENLPSLILTQDLLCWHTWWLPWDVGITGMYSVQCYTSVGESRFDGTPSLFITTKLCVERIWRDHVTFIYGINLFCVCTKLFLTHKVQKQWKETSKVWRVFWRVSWFLKFDKNLLR